MESNMSYKALGKKNLVHLRELEEYIQDALKDGVTVRLTIGTREVKIVQLQQHSASETVFFLKN